MRNLRNLVYGIERGARKLSAFILYSGGVVYKENKTSVKYNPFKRMSVNFKGFTSESHALYSNKFTEYSRDLYITDFQRYNVVPRINQRHGVILADKDLFSDFLYKYKHFLPAVFCSIKKGKIKSLDDGRKLNTAQKLFEYILNVGPLVFKPVAGYAGRGISIFFADGEQVRAKEEKFSSEAFGKYINSLDDYIAEEYVQQSDYAKNIYPEAANTIRILTYYDAKEGEAFIASLAHRFATNKSAPVDNFTRGALSAALDPETGILGSAAAHTSGGKINWTDVHPDTGAQIKGVKVEQWDFIYKSILELAEYAHYCPVIGWDIVSTKDGLRVIEANDSPGVDFLQLHKPILTNKRAADFLKEKGFLKKRQIKAYKLYHAQNS